MRTAGFFVAALLTWTTPARAQFAGPLPVVVFDIRGFYSGLGQDPTTAQSVGTDGVAATILPKRGLGGVAGLNFYLLRGRKVAIGLGAEGLLARGTSQPKDSEGAALGAPVTQKLRGLSGVLSLNFGHRDGWSYVSAGMGPLEFSTPRYPGVPTTTLPPTQMTLNMGGGARWFPKKHIAFGFDFRIYQTQPEVATIDYAGRQRAKLTVLSAGISIK